MRRILGQLFLIGVFALSCWAFDSGDVQRTAGLLNGRFWNALDNMHRLVYIMGGCDFSHDVCPSDLTFADMRDSVTEFYKEPENRAIPVAWAITFIRKKVEGASPAELEKWKADYRKIVNDLGKRESK